MFICLHTIRTLGITSWKEDSLYEAFNIDLKGI